MLCEKCINFNYAELVHSAFQVYYILWLFCLSILLIFESLLLKLQLKILKYLLKKISVHDDVWQKPTQYHKAIILQLGLNFKK